MLLERGVFAQGIGFPTVARGRARVRTIVCATHTHEQLDRALLAFEEVGTRLGLDRSRASGVTRWHRHASADCVLRVPVSALVMAHRTAAELEEERLEILAAQRDRAAFAPLYERYVDQIHAYVYTLTHDMEQADDVTAATFAKAMEELPRFEWRGCSVLRVAVSRRGQPGFEGAPPPGLDRARAAHAPGRRRRPGAPRGGERSRRRGARRRSRACPMISARRSSCASAPNCEIGRSPRSWGRSEGAVKLLTFRALTALRRGLGAPMPAERLSRSGS